MRGIKAAYTLAFWIIASACIGHGTNVWVGVGVFFALWTVAGFIETTTFRF